MKKTKKTNKGLGETKATTFFTPKRIAYIGLGLGAIGVGSYFYFTKQDAISLPQLPAADTKNTNQSGGGTASAGWTEGIFPLREGMKRNNDVYRLQQALIQKGHLPALTTSGASNADGAFGAGTRAALQKANYATEVSRELYNTIVSGGGAKSADTAVATSETLTSTARKLYYNVLSKKLTPVLDTLKTIQNVAAYSALNEQYKKVTDADTFVAKTIVTHLLEKFTADSDRVSLFAEFRRMGLKQTESGKWSLGGLSGFEYKTTVNTPVRKANGQLIMVKPGVILGEKIADNNGVTSIMTIDGEILRAPQKLLKNV